MWEIAEGSHRQLAFLVSLPLKLNFWGNKAFFTKCWRILLPPFSGLRKGEKGIFTRVYTKKTIKVNKPGTTTRGDSS